MLDLLGATTSLISTCFFIRGSYKAWPISLMAIFINSFLYWKKGIYADMSLEFAYLFFTCYGWYYWQSTKTIKLTNITVQLSKFSWLMLAISIIFLFTSIKLFLYHFTASTVSTLDAVTTSLSLTAQWLMCYKKIITWVLWFITDVIYGYLYWQKELPLHTLLMLVYTGLAILGYYTWKKGNKSDRLS